MEKLKSIVSYLQSKGMSMSNISEDIGMGRNFIQQKLKKKNYNQDYIEGLTITLVDKYIRVNPDITDLINLVHENHVLKKESKEREFFIKEQHKRIESGREQIQGIYDEVENLKAIITEKKEHIRIQDGIINNVRDKNKVLEQQVTILKKDLDYKEGVIRKQNANKKEHNELKEKHKANTGYIRAVENDKSKLDSKCELQYDYIQELKEDIAELKDKGKFYKWISAFLLVLGISVIIFAIYK